MKWKAKSHRRVLVRREQQAIGAEVVETDGIPSENVEHRPETARGKELQRQEVVTLHARLVIGISQALDRSKW